MALSFLLSTTGQAEEAIEAKWLERPSARLLDTAPPALQAGRCVRYEEKDASEAAGPRFYVQGTVLAYAIEVRSPAVCPAVEGKSFNQYTRAEFTRYLQAYPCVSAPSAVRPLRVGWVSVVVSDWETPHQRKAENTGRLWRGHFIEQPLAVGARLVVEADLLTACP